MGRILLLGGMTPDRRIFQRLLPLLPTAEIVEWIQPLPYETICAYAKRLSETIPRDDSTIVCGVSFGGIVARELAICLNAKACVLVSSVRSPQELPPWFRLYRAVPARLAEAALKAISTLAYHWPRALKTPSTWRLMKLGGTSGKWHRWATAALLNWRPSREVARIPLCQIHGDCDATFPLRYTSAVTVISTPPTSP